MDKFLNTEDLLIGKLDSLWLRDILLSGKIDDVETNWFANLVQRKLGRGNKNNFWNDSWIQDCSLKYLYPQLYHLSNDKHIKVENAQVIGRVTSGDGSLIGQLSCLLLKQFQLTIF
jgi:hypothetical protein